MINLDFQDYCKDCPGLEIGQKAEFFYGNGGDGKIVSANHVLYCHHKELCERLYKRLKEKMNI